MENFTRGWIVTVLLLAAVPLSVGAKSPPFSPQIPPAIPKATAAQWWQGYKLRITCHHDSMCKQAGHICVNSRCVPACIDSDAGLTNPIGASLPSTDPQLKNPGWVQHYDYQNAGMGKTKVTSYDACSGASLIEQYCTSGVTATEYLWDSTSPLPCPQGTTCQTITSPNIGQPIAYCGPKPAMSAPTECTPPAPDTDLDGIVDALDNCPQTANADQADADQNGFGDLCACNGGAPMQWTLMNNGLPADPISINAFHSHHGTLIAGTSGKGVFVSKDNGTSWQPANNGLPMTTVVVKFASLETTLYAATFAGVYRSTNDALSWEILSNGLPDEAPFGSGPPHVMGIGAWGCQLYAGVDGGTTDGMYLLDHKTETWSAANQGIPDTTNMTIYEFEPFGATVYAGGVVGGAEQKTALYVWQPGTQQWQSIAAGLPEGQVLVLHATGEQFFVGFGTADLGLFLYDPLAKTWKPASQGLPAKAKIYDMITYGGRLYTGGKNVGIYQSIDAGASWQPANAGLPYDNVPLYEFAAHNGYLFAATNEGLFRYGCP